MQTKIASYGKRFLALMLSLLMLVSVMPAAAWAAAEVRRRRRKAGEDHSGRQQRGAGL